MMIYSPHKRTYKLMMMMGCNNLSLSHTELLHSHIIQLMHHKEHLPYVKTLQPITTYIGYKNTSRMSRLYNRLPYIGHKNTSRVKTLQPIATYRLQESLPDVKAQPIATYWLHSILGTARLRG